MKLSKEELREIYKKILIVILGILFYYILFNFDDVTSGFRRYISYSRPIIFGLAIAFVANMLMNVFDNLFTKYINIKNDKTKNILSMILAYLTLTLIVTFFLSVVLPKFISSVINLLYQLPSLLDRFIDMIKNFQLTEKASRQLEDFVNDININNLVNRLINLVTEQGKFMLQGTLSIVSQIFSSFFEAFLAISFSVYVLSGKKRLKRNSKQVIYAVFPEKFSDKFIYYISLLYKNFYNFFTGQFLEAILMGFIVFFGITIIGAPYALILGVTSGLLNIIPYLGAVTGAAISTILIAITSPTKGLIYLIYIVIAQQIDGNYIYPNLVGSKIGIPPIWIMVAITIGGAVKGVVGMIIFVPIVATIYMMIRDFTKYRLEKKEINIDEK